MIMERKIVFFLIAVLVVIVLVADFFVTEAQVNKPIPNRCDIIKGTCAADCNGHNFPTPNEKNSDCPQGLICCLP